MSSPSSSGIRKPRFVSPSPTPPPLSPPSSLLLSTPQELSDLILDNDMIDPINDALDPVSTALAHLNHYSLVSYNLRRIEEDLHRHYDERRRIFDHLRHDESFSTKMKPVFEKHRAKQRRSRKPYTCFNVKTTRRSPSPPPVASTSSKNNTSSSSSDYATVLDIINSYIPLGSVDNPIDVDIPIIKVCRRCGQEGHKKIDCDTKIRSFDHCDTCDWLGRAQNLCDHYDVTPVDMIRLFGRPGVQIDIDDSD